MSWIICKKNKLRQISIWKNLYGCTCPVLYNKISIKSPILAPAYLWPMIGSKGFGRLIWNIKEIVKRKGERYKRSEKNKKDGSLYDRVSPEPGNRKRLDKLGSWGDYKVSLKLKNLVTY